MSTARKDISVVILTFNSERFIRRCLSPLLGTNRVSEIVVVDNRSTDRTIDEIKKTNNAKIKLVRNSRNIGFSRGVNIGIKATKSDKILILNPDTCVTTTAIHLLARCSAITKAGIVGGKLIKDDGSLHNSCVREPDIFTGLFDYTNLRKIVPGDYFHKHHYYLDEKIGKDPIEVDAVSGAYMLVDKRVFQQVGLFDESYFMYLEDIDFCNRARRAGFRVLFCPKSVIVHTGGASSNNPDRINYKAWSESRKLYFKNHGSFMENLLIQPIFSLDDLVSSIWRKLR